MTERMDHEEFDRLLSSGSGFADDELSKLATLARALERNRPTPAAMPSADPSFKAALRNRLLQEARRSEETVVIPLSLGARVRASVAARNTRMRRSFRSVVATAAAAAMLMVSGAAFAATAGSLPGEAGYGMKRFREDVQFAMTFGNEAKAQKQLDFARKRLEEVQALKDAGVESAALYAATFRDMDASTKDATARLIREFRSDGDESVLQPLIDFSRAQRGSIESILDQLPPGARPSARSSLELVVAVQDRVSDVLGGCPCPEDVLTPAGSSATGTPACTCEADRTDSSGLPKRNDSTGETPKGGPSPAPTPSNGGNDGGGNDDEPDEPGLPDLPGSDDDVIGDVITDVINSISPSPQPLPSLPVTLP